MDKNVELCLYICNSPTLLRKIYRHLHSFLLAQKSGLLKKVVVRAELRGAWVCSNEGLAYIDSSSSVNRVNVGLVIPSK